MGSKCSSPRPASPKIPRTRYFLKAPDFTYLCGYPCSTGDAIVQFLSLAEGKHEVDTHEVDKDNVPHWFRNTVWGFTERGCLVAAFGRQVDITEQKEIQRERYKLLNSLTAQQKKLMQLIGLHENIKLIADKLNFTGKTVSPNVIA